MPRSDPLPLHRFSCLNAVLLPAAGALSLALDAPWPYVVAGALSFAGFVAVCRGGYTPSGAFGGGNSVTALRLLVASSIGVVPASVPTWVLGGIVLFVFALDGLDGWVAKRRGEVSAFGAHFDMETDAYFVLLIGLVLFLRGRFGVWILGAGLLRYLYVLSLALIPAKTSGGERRRFPFGRHAFTGLMLGLTLGMVLGEPFGTVAAALGCGLVTASFADSFYFSYTRRA